MTLTSCVSIISFWCSIFTVFDKMWKLNALYYVKNWKLYKRFQTYLNDQWRTCEIKIKNVLASMEFVFLLMIKIVFNMFWIIRTPLLNVFKQLCVHIDFCKGGIYILSTLGLLVWPKNMHIEKAMTNAS